MQTQAELTRKAYELCGDIPTLCRKANIPYDARSKRFESRDGGTFPFDGLVFWLRPKNEGNTRLHRLYISCPLCQRQVPVGKYRQHVNTKACREG